MSKRIEYIDSLRGFCMLLVVCSHIIIMSYHGITGFSLNQIFLLFRMPLFFFISGFILYKPTNLIDLKLIQFLKKKFIVQIVPTVFFFLLYCYILDLPVKEGLYDHFKYGYWFTLTLFEFFLFYGITLAIGRFSVKIYRHETLLYIFSAIIIFSIYLIFLKGWIPIEISTMLGLFQFKHYPFLILGLLLRKYFYRFEGLMEHSLGMSVIIFCFGLSVYFLLNFELGIKAKLFLPYIPSVTGVIIAFSFFRRYQIFVSSSRLGKLFQYVGRRTLDVYLLHYFFLPRDLSFLGDFFSQKNNFILECFITLFIPILVILACLGVSKIFRLSSLYEYYLFGVKRK